MDDITVVTGLDSSAVPTAVRQDEEERTERDLVAPQGLRRPFLLRLRRPAPSNGQALHRSH